MSGERSSLPAPVDTTAPAVHATVAVPAIIADVGNHAARRFLEFFAATIRNKNTRMAYYQAVCPFFAWVDELSSFAMQTRLFDDADLVQFYDIENGWADDDRYCCELALGKKTVLDLGCGTGRLAAALAPGREVFGIDSAAAMLTTARQREGGSAVTWIEADARSVRLGRPFELIVLTGHTFQVFLTDEDQRAVCDTIAAHLAPGGAFIFDSREPSREEWRKWEPSRSLRSIRHPTLGRIAAWNDVACDPASEIVTYWTFYRASDGRSWEAQSRIRFAGQKAIAARIAEAGLSADRWLGNWRGDQWTPEAKDIIAMGSLAR